MAPVQAKLPYARKVPYARNRNAGIHPAGSLLSDSCLNYPLVTLLFVSRFIETRSFHARPQAAPLLGARRAGQTLGLGASSWR